MDPEFLNTDGEHEHDTSVSSLSIIQKGEVDLEAVQDWVGWVLREKATDIYRMKGVLAIAHARQKFVYQAVHMIFNGNFEDSEVWGPDEERESKLVFIGKNLDKEALKVGFAACVATPYQQRAYDNCGDPEQDAGDATAADPEGRRRRGDGQRVLEAPRRGPAVGIKPEPHTCS